MQEPGLGRERIFFYSRGRDQAGIENFEMTGVGTGKIENAGAVPGSVFFLLPGPGRDLIFFIVGAGIFFIARAGIGNFFIAGVWSGPGSEFFYCRDRGRGRAGI